MSNRSATNAVCVLTSTRGHSSPNSIKTGGRTLIRCDSEVPMRSRPVTASGSCTVLSARRTAFKISSAWGSSRSPACVSVTCLPMRSKSCAPSASSSCLICIVTADCE